MAVLDENGLAHFWGKIKNYVDTRPGSYLVKAPVGTIVIWSGTADNIPTGWQLCDGTNGTPDLRDKFVLGAGTSHTVGDTGGSETVTLTVEQMPRHNHNVGVGMNSTSGTDKIGKAIYSTPSTTKPTTEYAGSGTAHENMPPYYALCYIIKIAPDETDGGGGGEKGNPLGTIISFMGKEAPKDYLVCDGSEYTIEDYKELAAFFALQFGSMNHFGGDGISTFAVPDLRNMFLRGYHGESEEQLSGNVGEKQEATKHTTIYNIKNGETASPALTSAGTPQTSYHPDNMDTKFYNNRPVYGTAFASDWTQYVPQEDRSVYYTSRPLNMAVLYCIKAKESFSAGAIYSTEERVVGTWIDGRPIYKKTYSLQTPGSDASTTGWVYVTEAIPGFDISIKKEGCVLTNTEGGATEFIPYSAPGNDNSIAMLVTTAGRIGLYARGNKCSKQCYITILYIKTTDQATIELPAMLTVSKPLYTAAPASSATTELMAGIGNEEL